MCSTLSAVIVTIVLFMFFRLRKSGKKCLEKSTVRPIPGLQPASDSLGNLGDLQQAGSLHQFLLRLRKQFGPVAGFWFGPQYCVSITSGKLFKEVHHLFDRPSIFYDFFKPLITEHAIPYANGERGQKRHKIVSESFSSQTLVNTMPSINKICKTFADEWEKLPKDEHIALEEDMMALAVKTITTTQFGAYFRESNKDRITKFHHLYDKVWLDMESQLVGSFPMDNPERVKEFQTNTKVLRTMCQDILRQHKKARELGDYEVAPFLDTLIDYSPNEDVELADCTAFVVGGFHTTGMTLTWMLHFISHHPDVQDKIVEELETVLEHGQKELDGNSMKKLKYLRHAIDETLRLSIIAPYAGRMSDKDLRVNGHIIPAGTPVLVGLGVAMQDEDTFANPKKFDPDRFSSGPHSYGTCYSPFGLGPRRCPGFFFAYHEVCAAVAAILPRFKILPVNKNGEEEVGRIYGLVTKPDKDIWITLEKRKKTTQ